MSSFANGLPGYMQPKRVRGGRMTRQNTAPVEDTPADPEPEPDTEEQNPETKEEEENDAEPEELQISFWFEKIENDL